MKNIKYKDKIIKYKIIYINSIYYSSKRQK